jgi:hypothetical protein
VGYYVRVLSTSDSRISLSELQAALDDKQLKATLTIEDESEDDWTQITLSHLSGQPIALLERNVVEASSLGSEELAEFAAEVADCKPASAAQWLLEYFPRVKCVYAFQVLSGTYKENGWDILDAVRQRIWSAAPAILQADNEGFSNEAGYHILWQFDDSVDGPWSMAVLSDRQWQEFEMDLGNRAHREAFLQGKVPSDV